MRRMTRTALAVAVAAIAGLGIAGCAGAAEKTIEHTAGSVALAPGETLVVDFGEINPSVGDAWVITQEPDAAVLDAGVEETRYTGEEGMTGAPSELFYRFAPVGSGTTIIEFEYQFRGAVPEDAADQKTAKIEVTVR